MSANVSLSSCESFSVRHYLGLGIVFLVLLFAAAGTGVLRAWQADSAEQLFGDTVVMAVPAHP